MSRFGHHSTRKMLRNRKEVQRNATKMARSLEAKSYEELCVLQKVEKAKERQDSSFLITTVTGKKL